MTSFDFSKVEIFGDEYIPEYAWIELDRLRRERSYQNYMATAAELTAWNAGHQKEARYLTASFSDLMDPDKPHEEQKEITVEEIKKKQKAALHKLFGGGRK